MLFGTFEAHGAQQVRDAAAAAQRDNSARLSFSTHHQESSGVGDFTIAAPIMFDMPFLTRPVFTQGAALKVAPNVEEYGIPQGSATVYRWERNPKGHYTGAYIALSVKLASVMWGQPPDVQMIHDLVFMGIGYKDLGSKVAVEAQLVGARPVGFGSTS